MNKKIFFLLLFLNFTLILVPFQSEAVSLFPEQLVPCNNPDDCNLSSLAKGAGNLLKFLIAITVTGSVLVFAWVGIKYMTNQGDSSQVKAAHGIFKQVAIGLALVLAAWLIVSTLLKLLTDKNLDQYKNDYLIEQNI